MNRYNFGNVVTNAMQIGSTGTFTAARSLGNAANALNNLSPKERKEYSEMEADKIRSAVKEYNEQKEFERMESLIEGTPQSKELNDYVNSTYKYIQNRINGKFAKGGTFVKKEGGNNADV